MATVMAVHECNRQTRQEFRATMDDPYHFVDSGLPNVYLSGIRYFRCECGQEMADIPAIKQLGFEPETLSRIENDHLPASERTDKLIRLYYAVASKDPLLLGQLQDDLDQRLMAWQRIVLPSRKISASVRDNEWTLVAA